MLVIENTRTCSLFDKEHEWRFLGGHTVIPFLFELIKLLSSYEDGFLDFACEIDYYQLINY